ncbi:hypothetical protein, partial [uncultured Tateyamaria sp.]|uniref:hypothetical protein n=1 Tax=uncultured Tateyamaria sp. TaxID=455651 RepID=UPI002605D32A
LPNYSRQRTRRSGKHQEGGVSATLTVHWIVVVVEEDGKGLWVTACDGLYRKSDSHNNWQTDDLLDIGADYMVVLNPRDRSVVSKLNRGETITLNKVAEYQVRADDDPQLKLPAHRSYFKEYIRLGNASQDSFFCHFV